MNKIINYLIIIALSIICVNESVYASYSACSIPYSYYNPVTGMCNLNPINIYTYANTTALSSINKYWYRNGWDVVQITYANVAGVATFSSDCAWGGAGNAGCQHPSWEWDTNPAIETLSYYTASGAYTDIYRCAAWDINEGYYIFNNFIFDVDCRYSSSLSSMCGNSVTYMNSFLPSVYMGYGFSCGYLGRTTISNSEFNVCPSGYSAYSTTISPASCTQIISAWGLATGIWNCTTTTTYECRKQTALGCPNGTALVAGVCVFNPSCPDGGTNINGVCEPICTSPRYPAGWVSLPSVSAGMPVRASDFAHIRNNIDLMRGDAALPYCSYSEPITGGVTHIKKTHLDELRTCISGVYSRCGVSVPVFTNTNIIGGETKVKAVDVQEIVNAVNNAP